MRKALFGPKSSKATAELLHPTACVQRVAPGREKRLSRQHDARRVRLAAGCSLSHPRRLISKTPLPWKIM